MPMMNSGGRLKPLLLTSIALKSMRAPDHNHSHSDSISTSDAEESPKLSDVFRLFGDSYRQAHRLPLQQIKAIEAIKGCQTEAMGCHINECNACGYVEGAFNSCRNRNCNRCMWNAQRRWLEARESELLNVPYYHVVFTLPHYFFSFGLFNQEFLYTILMAASAETLKQFGQDAEHLGAKSGFESKLARLWNTTTRYWLSIIYK